MMKKRVYCDHNATTPVLPVIKQRYATILEDYGNASSLYLKGRQAKEALENARYCMADAIGARPDEIIFCGSGTEANNHVLQQCIYKKVIEKERVHVLVSAIEHSSVLETTTLLKQYGVEVDIIPVDGTGKVDIERYKALFKSYTFLVVIMFANNELGTIQQLSECAEIAHQHGALLHSDGVQALGKIAIDVNALTVDFMAFSSHKVYAPKGVGVLYVKNEELLRPLLFGGMHERGLRASTENIPTILAFELALNAIDVNHYQQYTAELKTYFIDKLKKIAGVKVSMAH